MMKSGRNCNGFTVIMAIENGKGVTLILTDYSKMLTLFSSHGSLPRITGTLLFRSDWTFLNHAKPLGGRHYNKERE
jgi:hypothetical protein